MYQKKLISLYHYSHLNPSPPFVPDTEIRILQIVCKYEDLSLYFDVIHYMYENSQLLSGNSYNLSI